MHVPDGFINAQVSAATGIISLGTLWAYIRNAKNLVADKLIALTGMMSALIFVLQMINFPIAAGTSGHLLGGALAVIVLGPSLGVICISIVVVIQSLLFADGGSKCFGCKCTKYGNNYFSYRMVHHYLFGKSYLVNLNLL